MVVCRCGGAGSPVTASDCRPTFRSFNAGTGMGYNDLAMLAVSHRGLNRTFLIFIFILLIPIRVRIGYVSASVNPSLSQEMQVNR